MVVIRVVVGGYGIIVGFFFEVTVFLLVIFVVRMWWVFESGCFVFFKFFWFAVGVFRE